MNDYRWDVEQKTVIKLGTRHAMVGVGGVPMHTHFVPVPPDPNPVEVFCGAPMTMTGVKPRIVFEEERTKDRPPVEAVYFFHNPTQRLKWKTFRHYKRYVLYPAGNVVLCSQINAPQPGWCRECCTDGAYLWSTNSHGGIEKPFNGLIKLRTGGDEIVPNPVGLSNLIARSLQTMLPAIKPELSIVNSLIELKDFKSLPRTIVGMKNWLLKGPKTLRQHLRSTADGFLQGNFNVLPLLSDITGIHRAIANTKKQVNELVARQNKLQKRHFTANLDEFVDSKVTGSPHAIQKPHISFPTLSGQAVDTRTVTYADRTFHAEIMYSYWIPKYQLEHAQLNGMLDALGVNLNPSIIWNAIPWSFAVDWVFGVSRWLDQFKVRNLEPVCLIHRYLWSARIQRQVLCTCTVNPVGGHRGSPEVTACQHDETAYIRSPGMPDIYNAIQVTGLNPKEFALGSALAISRFF
jgi:hypothetical protein